MKQFTLLCSLLLLGACNFEYEKALCTAENAEDIIGLPGNYRFQFVDEHFERQDQAITIRWAGETGSYLINDRPARVCRIGSRSFLEGFANSFRNNSKADNSGLAIQEIMPVTTPEGFLAFDFIYLGVSAQSLEEAGIPYTIIEQGNTSQRGSVTVSASTNDSADEDDEGDGNTNLPNTKLLHIQNGNVSTEVFANLLGRTSIRYSLDPGPLTKQRIKK